MARTTNSKAEQDRKQREAAAAEREAAATETGPALEGGTVIKQGSGGAAVGSQAQPATRNAVDVVAVDEIPKPDRSTKEPSVWVQRLQAVEKTPKGKGRIFQANTKATAGGTAARVRKALKEGKFDEQLGAGAGKRFTLIQVGTDIYAEVKRPA